MSDHAWMRTVAVLAFLMATVSMAGMVAAYHTGNGALFAFSFFGWAIGCVVATSL